MADLREWVKVILPLLLAITLLVVFSRSVTAQDPDPVCLWSEQGPVAVGRRVGLSAAGLPEPEMLLSTLLEGPTAQERAQGLWSAIPQDTALDGVEVRPDDTVIVRLRMPVEALDDLDHGRFEVIVRQIGWTLEPLRWRDLRIQTWDPADEAFVPLASFLPPIPAPRKEGVADDVDVRGESLGYTGQPPAPGQGQPQGALSGKTVYVSAGHGWQWTGYAWRAQRPPYPNPPYPHPIIEDHNNAEAVNQYLLQYLWNAGARVIPVRERDLNAVQVVVDNDDPAPGTGYSETGDWTTTSESGTGYADSDYRFAETATGAPSATAEWTATLPSSGRYAVYAWYRQGPSRTPEAHYTVHHAGGSTAVVVDQQKHGNTWHYLGTYGFLEGEPARVVLSNEASQAGDAVIADAVRFGGGTFDSLYDIETTAPEPPDKPWWEVCTFYYAQRMGMDQPPGDVVARPIYARWEHAGTDEDAVYVSWHTNGYSGYQWDYRGTMSIIHNGDWSPVTEGSEELRDAVHNELVDDIRAAWDPTWPEYLREMNLGELRELWDPDPDVRMPGVLIEVAYHDHPGDTDALREPTFQMLAARAVYQGIVKYYDDGAPLLPEPPTHPRLENVGGGQVRISWQPSPTDTVGVVGDLATGYRVYTSTNGIGWSNRISVSGTTAYTLTGLTQGELLFVRVAATNAGGESFSTETLGVRVGPNPQVLLVNGFDRLNNTMQMPDFDPVEGYNVRLLLDQMNRYDYVIQHAEAISYPFDSAANEAVSDTLVALDDYLVVDWVLGEESQPNQTLNAAERSLLESYLNEGGALFLSGTEVGWHLDDQGADPDFYGSSLRASFVGDDAGTYQVAPASGSIFQGLDPFRFDASGMYDADYPDQIAPVNGSAAALAYQGGAGGTAAVQYADGTDPCHRLVYFGFPFETIWPEHRPAVMGRVMDFLGLCLEPPVDTAIDSPVDGEAYRSKPSFTGTAEGGAGAPLDRVEVQVWRSADGQYWDGDGSTWGGDEVWTTANYTDSWSSSLPTLTEGDFRLRARAWVTGTRAYSDTSPAEVTFTYDTLPPTSTKLITPTGGVTVTGLPSLVLEWDAIGSDGGSALGYTVDLDGQPYTTTQSVYTVTAISSGAHTWGVQVFDAAGNRSGWVTTTFSIERYTFHLPLAMRGSGASCSDVMANGGFETDGGWSFNRLAVYGAEQVHSGARSARVGIPPGQTVAGEVVWSSVSQVLTLPVGSEATLRLWVYPINEGDDPGDQHYVVLFDGSGGYHSLDGSTIDQRSWVFREYDLSAYVGQTVTLYIGAKNDGDDDTTSMYIDDVALEVCP